MEQKSLVDQVLSEAVTAAKSDALESVAGPKPSNPKAAIRRCCAAYERAYQSKIAELDNPKDDWYKATTVAQEAYYHAMPTLAGYEGIRDFVACIAHALLIDVIREGRAAQLLNAAKVALATFSHAPKSLPNSVRAAVPRRNSPQIPTFEGDDSTLSIP